MGKEKNEKEVKKCPEKCQGSKTKILIPAIEGRNGFGRKKIKLSRQG